MFFLVFLLLIEFPLHFFLIEVISCMLGHELSIQLICVYRLAEIVSRLYIDVWQSHQTSTTVLNITN